MNTTTPTLVTRARSGDTQAFSTLVARHERAALAYATSLLRDPVAAEDAVQDAFVQAWLKLDQLDEPAAFPGWLRRVVFTRCDRQLRKRRALDPLDEAASTHLTPEGELLDRRRRDALRRSLETLPEHERFVVALHYLAELPVKDIAAFLSLSVPAVKKRLFTARQRLRILEEPMQVPAPRPLSQRVALFLALRAGDAEQVDRLLTERPDLLEAEERWSDQEALEGGFTLAHHLTPLILAAGYGDVALVDLLLARGASPEGRCGCDNGETALWAAARAGFLGVVQRLLKAGAAPNPTNAAGHTPLDLATWRGHQELIDLLTRHGGTRSGPAVSPLVPAARLHPDGRLTTGIKALDLWAPLTSGDVVRVHGAAETGLVVLLAELAAHVGRAGGVTVWTSWQRHPWHRRELEVLAARYGVDPFVQVVVADEGSADAHSVTDRGLARCRELAGTHPLVVHVVFEVEGHAAEVEAAFPAMGEAAHLTLAVRPWAAVTRGELAPPTAGGAHQAVIRTETRLAALGLWPAVDPIHTASCRGDDALRAEARALLARLEALDPTLALSEVEPTEDVQRGRALLAWLTQPFVTAWPDTGWPGVSVDAATTAADVHDLLHGALRDPSDLRYRGGLPR